MKEQILTVLLTVLVTLSAIYVYVFLTRETMNPSTRRNEMPTREELSAAIEPYVKQSAKPQAHLDLLDKLVELIEPKKKSKPVPKPKTRSWAEGAD